MLEGAVRVRGCGPEPTFADVRNHRVKRVTALVGESEGDALDPSDQVVHCLGEVLSGRVDPLEREGLILASVEFADCFLGFPGDRHVTVGVAGA